MHETPDVKLTKINQFNYKIINILKSDFKEKQPQQQLIRSFVVDKWHWILEMKYIENSYNSVFGQMETLL